MASKAQINANRANAQKSTGPRTEEGKARSRFNRLSHGLTGSLVCAPLENREDLDRLLAELQDHFQPANIDEQMLVEKMALNQWLSLRAYRFQAVSLNASVPRGCFHPSLDVLIRYHQSSDRGFYKARAELLKAQKERKKSENGFVSPEAQTTAEPDPHEAPPPPPNPATPTPKPPEMPDFVSVEDQIADIQNEPVEQMVKEYFLQRKSAPKAA